jgi:adenylate kinase
LTAVAAPPRPSILLIGPTGSGKTPLGEEIERRGLHGRRCAHFDFGAALRRLVAGQDDRTFLSEEELTAVRSSLASGALFEDRDMPMILKILGAFAEARALEPDSLLVLNGLPRHVRQAEALAATVSVGLVVSLEADAGVIRERLRLDPGGDRSGRPDDTVEAVGRRLADFAERTLALLGYYRKRSCPIVSIRVTAALTAAEMYGILDREAPV